MSEFQYIGFRAIDKPVSDKDLEYMRQQSSRAEITPWSFDNEYHYGDFRGDAVKLLRRGYDIHLHYANFGIAGDQYCHVAILPVNVCERRWLPMAVGHPRYCQLLMSRNDLYCPSLHDGLATRWGCQGERAHGRRSRG